MLPVGHVHCALDEAAKRRDQAFVGNNERQQHPAGIREEGIVATLFVEREWSHLGLTFPSVAKSSRTHPFTRVAKSPT